MQPVQPASRPDGRRAWLAALVLQQPDRFLPRLAVGLARLRALPRGYRRRLQRYVALTAAGAALMLALAGSPLLTPAAHAATITVNETTCTLIDAIIAANTDTAVGGCLAGSGSDTITLQTDVTLTSVYGDYMGDTGLPAVTSEIVIEGDGHTIERDGAAPDFRILYVGEDGNLTLSDVTISGGKASNNTYGGGIFHKGQSLSLESSTISGNVADYGGGIYATGGSLCLDPQTALNITNSNVNDNTADFGGGVYAYCVITDIDTSDFTGNDANDWGGAVSVDEGSATINASTITGNTAQREGGGVYLRAGEVRIYDSKLNGNTVYNHGHGGGAVYTNGYMYITDSEMSGNTSHVYGGAINSDGGLLSLTRVVITDNTATDRGGGVFNFGDDMDIVDSIISDNHSIEDEGGGLFSAADTLDIVRTVIDGNTAGTDGGGIYARGTVTIVNSTISGNGTTENGGGIYLDGATATILNSTVTGNSAGEVGGLKVDVGTLILARTIVSGNTDPGGSGHEIWNGGGTVTADDYNVFSHDGQTMSDAFYGFAPGGSDFDASSDAGDVPLTAILDTTLADNGGPTLTHNLVAGSPAVDLAPDADCTVSPVDGVDQRGAARPFDVAGQGNDGSDTCDAGAVEYNSPLPGNSAIFMSTTTAGTTGDGLAFGPEDIIQWDGDAWSTWFDGSAAGLMPFNA
ncbi:MAG: hypothetical protein KIS95_12040, partial [Anaerolineae bacterium]|nr:hypothetical protein [Anaerolineae bacterium]